MAKQLDPYAPCSCGSGEKLKFCCQKILAEMDEVYEALSRDRVATAKSALDRARPKAVGHNYSEAWINTMSAVLIGREQGSSPALNELKPVLEKTPDFALAWIVASQLLLSGERVDEAMGALEQALGHLKQIPSPLVPLLGELAISMVRRNEFLTGVYLSTLALNLSGNNASEEIVELWKEIRTEPRASLLLRMPPLVSFEVRGTPLGDKAAAAFGRGQMRLAARYFRESAEASQSSTDWARVALSLCYAGLSREAVPAFKKAAELESDFERSVEFEAFAQQIARDVTLPRPKVATRSFEVGDMAALSQYLNADPRCEQVPTSGMDQSGDPTIAHWVVLSQPMPASDQPCSPATVPCVTSRMSVFSVPEEIGQRFLLYAYNVSGMGGETTLDEILAGAGACISPRDSAESPGQPQEVVAVVPDLVLPKTLRHDVKMDWLRTCADHFTHEVWAKTPQAGLDGKTPLAAKDDPAQRRALAAAILVYTTMAHSFKEFMDENDLRAKLGLPSVAELEPAAEGQLEVAPAEARRWRLAALTVDRLNSILMRLSSIQAPTLTIRFAVELASRPIAESERLNANLMAARLFQQLGNCAKAIDQITQAHALADTISMPFESRLQFDLIELRIIGDGGQADRAKELAHAFWNKYSAKIPEARSSFAEMLTRFAGEGPWSSTIDLAAGIAAPQSGSFTASGLWTPDASTASEPAKKLWIPGS